MGRGQATETDRFGAVFGNRRGLGQKHEELAQQIHTLFSNDRGAARRRARLVRWWLDNNSEPHPLPYFTMFSKAYDDAWRFDKGEKRERLVSAACRNDLNSLTQQGICKKARFGSAPSNGLNLVDYDILPIREWPPKHRQAFEAWQRSGCPDWHSPMGSYSPSSSSTP